MFTATSKMWLPLLLLSATFLVVNGFSSDERFLKKYALIKIFESCFGQEVVKEIRKELKAACAKCASMETQVLPTAQSTPKPNTHHKLDGMVDPENSVYANQQTFAPEKLHQAILAYRPNPFPSAALRPYAGTPAQFYQAFGSPGSFYYGSGYPAGPLVASPYALPFFAQPGYPGGARMSRDMDFKGQFDMLPARLNSRLKNISCIMQELGYLDENLQPNYEKINERVSNLPVAQELRRDILDGVSYCQQFSQCVPEPKRATSPLARELTKPMLFFKCYKYKKLEACVMKDVREKFSDISEEDLDGEGEFRRNGRSMKQVGDVYELEVILYEFLYGADNSFEFDNML